MTAPFARVLRLCLMMSVLSGARLHAQPVAPAAGAWPQADLRWSVFTLGGEERTLERFRGRVLLINSWATWCEPCVAELRSLTALRAAVPDTSLVFALVAAQRKEPVAAFVRRRALTLPVYLEASPAPAVYRFDAVPTTWIIDREGRIVYRRRGAMRWDTPAVTALITSLLAQSPPQ